ncbi:Rhodanese-related sulfurtransferase [Savitreella phatthalungensis]
MNPIEGRASEEVLRATARDATQLLLNSILSCPIETSHEGTIITLPEGTTHLPREKPVPAEKKAETKWEKFARLKGIASKRRRGDGKLVFDEESGEWVPSWGYKGKNKADENAWLVEMDSSKFADNDDPRAVLRKERKDRAKNSGQVSAKSSKAIKDAKMALGIRSTSGGKAKVGKVKHRSRRH